MYDYLVRFSRTEVTSSLEGRGALGIQRHTDISDISYGLEIKPHLIEQYVIFYLSVVCCIDV